jgi:hypothetical protein
MIGEEPDEALLCVTDIYQFFNDSEIIRNVGRWYFLNGSSSSTVSTNMSNAIYMTSDLGVVRLHRKNTGNNSLPFERLRCEILDSSNISQCIYATVYYNESMSITSYSLASDSDSSHTGSAPTNEESQSSSPTTIIVEVDSKVSAGIIGGAGVGGLLLMVIITVGVILVILLIKR